MNVAILWDVALCSPHVNRRFGGMYHLHLQQESRVQQVTRHHVGSHADYMALCPRGRKHLMLLLLHEYSFVYRVVA
jgi:hypothetical protein